LILWQRRLRLAIALGAVALTIVVAFAFQRRVEVAVAPLIRSDPKALVETIGGRTIRYNRDDEPVEIYSENGRTYPDGTAALTGVRITTKREGGRTFVLRANEARVGKSESEYIVEGAVRMTSDDGLAVETERATYLSRDGIVRAAGPVTFARGRMSGSGVGFEYDKARDVVRILSEAVVSTAGAAGGEAARMQAPMILRSGTLELERVPRIVRFGGGVHAERAAETIDAASGVAYLTPKDDRLQRLELRGDSRITAPPGAAGSLQSMAGRDIDLTYAADGETLQHARVDGNATVLVAGEPQQPAREIGADLIEVPLTSDGAAPRAITARGDVELTLPGGEGVPLREITADALDGKGEDGKGLTSATFSGRVRFEERGDQMRRAGTSERLDVALTPGLGSIDEATFMRRVEFVDGDMTGRAAHARYALADGVLDLTGSEPATPRPTVRNDQIAVDAAKIQLTLAGPKVHAAGAVKSVLRPESDRNGKDRRKTPSMFKDDQPVNVTADELQYDGDARNATYTGNATLWQAETTIKASTITLDDRTGNLTAAGSPLATTTVLNQTGKDGKKERSIANAKSEQLRYEEALRRATYSGDAYVNGPQGELRAARIELYLKESGDELERAEAFEGVTLAEQRRRTTGDHLVYTSADERYVVTGRPMKITDECERVTEGRTLTYLKGAERIIVDGAEQMRTRTQGGAKCP
jgi:LPS export ABC transporter protein LptC/lipopolysaccharide transport protein LptA